ncbi:MAG: hypothetical protein ACFCUT_01505 [Kiloniellaceae bacterium]
MHGLDKVAGSDLNRTTGTTAEAQTASFPRFTAGRKESGDPRIGGRRFRLSSLPSSGSQRRR